MTANPALDTPALDTPAGMMATRYVLSAIIDPDRGRVSVEDVRRIGSIVVEWISDTFSASVASDLMGAATVNTCHSDAANRLWLTIVRQEQRGIFVRSNHYGDFAVASPDEIASLTALVERIVAEVLPLAVATSQERVEEFRRQLA